MVGERVVKGVMWRRRRLLVRRIGARVGGRRGSGVVVRRGRSS